MRLATLCAAAAMLATLAVLAPARVLAAMPVTADVPADRPSAVSVTVYRAPARGSGSIDLNALHGFALVTETRTVRLPAGAANLRFEGVAEGIEPSSAIVTGLTGVVFEKNREGRLLSPSALMSASVGQSVVLVRTHPKTGQLERVAGTVRSDAGGGVVFQTAEGAEALRCSGLSETFHFTANALPAATPTLSVRVRSPTAATQTATLSYLAREFDWAADYVAKLSADGRTMDLGAWVTLANGNGAAFPLARTQVVAGRVNRVSGDVEPLDAGGPLLAQCWPRGSTSGPPELLEIDRPVSAEAGLGKTRSLVPSALAAPLMQVTLSAQRRVEQEQLGDLKLYRVPDPTTIASRQSKQVRLMDRFDIPLTAVFGADLAADAQSASAAPAHLLLRTENDAAHHLGLPLPSGRIAVFGDDDGATLLLRETGMRDLAVDEEVEIDMGERHDVQLAARRESVAIDPGQTRLLPLVPGVIVLRTAKIDDVIRVDITNARSEPIQFELRLRLPAGARVVRADHPMADKNGRPIFRLAIAANDGAAVRFQTQRSAVSRVE